MWEVVAYTSLLMKHGMAPEDICLKQLEQQDAMTFRLRKYGLNYLFGMLNCLRYPHEYPVVSRQALYFHQNGFNFYVAFVLAHLFGPSCNHGNHSLLSTYSWNCWETKPWKVLEMANQVEKYFLVDGPKENAFVDQRKSEYFNIQSSINSVQLKNEIPELDSWDALAKCKPLYWKKGAK
ncbi:MAG: hypothetical protein ACXABY_06060 [Candidatus Thorarchaeota archaeon]|jgi:hypothetical protein